MFLFYFMIGVLLLIVLWLGLRWFADAEPRHLVTAAKWTAVAVGGAVAIWLIVTGRAGQALMVASALAPMFVRWKALWTRLRNAGGPAPGGRSNIETAWLRMSLDHDSGAMEGIVLKGAERGRNLGELSLGALLNLLAECRIDDADSAALLEAYLDRLHPGWRDGDGAAAGEGNTPATPSAAMTRDEAWRILGLEPGADAAAIRDAHKRLMKKLHPDQGGSSYLAAKINQAKDLLLGE
jgi:hypothetical protein